MSTETMYAVVFFVDLIGAALQASCGFGYGVLTMCVLPFVMNYTDALVTSGMISILTSAAVWYRHRRSVSWRVVVWPTATNIIFSILATYFLKNTADSVMRTLLGGTLIVLSLYLMFASSKLRIRASAAAGLASGSLGGAMSAMFGMGGPPIVLYMLAAAESAEIYIANTQAYFAFTCICTGVIRAANGLVTQNVLVCTAIGSVGAIIGLKAGSFVFGRMSETALRRTVYVVMLISGAMLIAN